MGYPRGDPPFVPSGEALPNQRGVLTPSPHVTELSCLLANEAPNSSNLIVRQPDLKSYLRLAFCARCLREIVGITLLHVEMVCGEEFDSILGGTIGKGVSSDTENVLSYREIAASKAK